MLLNLILRWISGEKLTKATPEECRVRLGLLFIGEVFALMGIAFGGPIIDRANAIGLWIGATAVISIGVFASFLWARFVPARVSLVLAIIGWLVLLWVGLRQTL